ncbi:MAG: ATP-binding protein [Candidatus Levybacteria bacterium]|nr:ATP-binding protein [Candidatus Levybacteria bacterium]
MKSKFKFNILFNNDICPMLLVDNDFIIKDINYAASNLFEISKENLIGKKMTDFINPKFTNKSIKSFREFLQDKKQKGEFNIKLSSGAMLEVEYFGIANYFQDYHLYIFHDITEHKIEEKRQEFYLNVLGHELKTPLASIKAFAQIIQIRIKKGDSKKSTLYLSRIDEQVDKLTRFVNALLDVTRIRAEKLKIYREVFDFDELVDDTIKKFKSPLYEKYKIIKKGKAGRNIIADKNRIGEVLRNLISNAIKYSSDSNKIIINVLSDKTNIIFNVQDFGLGISNDQQNKIFEPFFKVHVLDKEFYSGLCLGLHISSEIAKIHGGKIWVESKEGVGSTFYLSLPIKAIQ